MDSSGVPISIAVVDARPLVAAALASWLGSHPSFHVRSVCTPPFDHREIDQPTVCVLCIAEGSWDWESTVTALRGGWSGVPIVMTLGAAPDRSLDAALELGVRGLVCEHGAAEDLPKAIEAVHRGETYLCPTVIGRMSAHGACAAAQSRCASLTAREREVLRYLAGGQTKREIAEAMHLSPKTIDNHATAIMSKLNIHNRVALARFAIREGILNA
ncbi:MAG: response regulator transcription factor [Phycisphaerales bacterium]|nr:response regulator transcription factor [Phycisphaerales bacterium]